MNWGSSESFLEQGTNTPWLQGGDRYHLREYSDREAVQHIQPKRRDRARDCVETRRRLKRLVKEGMEEVGVRLTPKAASPPVRRISSSTSARPAPARSIDRMPKNTSAIEGFRIWPRVRIGRKRPCLSQLQPFTELIGDYARIREPHGLTCDDVDLGQVLALIVSVDEQIDHQFHDCAGCVGGAFLVSAFPLDFSLD